MVRWQVAHTVGVDLGQHREGGQVRRRPQQARRQQSAWPCSAAAAAAVERVRVSSPRSPSRAHRSMALRHSGRDARHPSSDGRWAASSACERARGPPHQASSMAAARRWARSSCWPASSMRPSRMSIVTATRRAQISVSGSSAARESAMASSASAAAAAASPSRSTRAASKPRSSRSKGGIGTAAAAARPRRACSRAGGRVVPADGGQGERPLGQHGGDRGAVGVGDGRLGQRLRGIEVVGEHVGGGAHRQGFGAEGRGGRRPAREQGGADRLHVAGLLLGGREQRDEEGVGALGTRRRARCTTRARR